MNMVPERATPTIQANFFCLAPTYSGTWFLTISRPMIRDGENLGLIKTRMIKSVRKSVIEYFASKKSLLNRIRIRDMKINRKSIPAAARISLSFSTGILYPGTSSPNWINLLMVEYFKDYQLLTLQPV